MTGCSPRPSIELWGPFGHLHDAPGDHVHHWLRSCRSTGPELIVNESDPGTRFSGGAPGKSFGSSGRSATVTYSVSATNAANWAFVTWHRSIENPSTPTRC